MISLPESVVSLIISFLPQNDKFNLLQTNYTFYEATLPHLYRSLCLRNAASLKDDNGFQECRWTIIGGYSNPLIKPESQEGLVRARQAVLLQSLKVNPELVGYVENVCIFGQHGPSVVDVKLFELIKNNCFNLKSYRAFNADEKLHLTEFQLSRLPRLESCMINHAMQLAHLPGSVRNLSINFFDEYKKEVVDLEQTQLCRSKLYQLDSLSLSSDEMSSFVFLRFICDHLLETQRKLHLKQLKIIYYHGFTDYDSDLRELVSTFVFNFVHLESIESLEMVLGCDERGCKCLCDFVDKLAAQPLLNLRKVSFIEKTCHRDHDFTENFDLHLVRLMLHIPKPENISYLAIMHSPPLDGALINGFEGNYIRRRTLYQKMFPLLTNLQTLVSPSFMQTCSCYEVLTSDLLWNGCQCSFCEPHLSIFDEYIMNHSYLDETTGLVKDVISPRFFAAASDSVSKRMITHEDVEYNASLIDVLSFPPALTTWDFHGYFSFSHKAHYYCTFNQSAFPALVKAISHFVVSYLQPLQKTNPHLQLAVMSGIYFRRSKDGFECVYD